MEGTDIKQSLNNVLKMVKIMTMINVKNIINDSFSSISGRKLGQRIGKEASKEKKSVIVNFDWMTPFTSLFFNAMLEELISYGNIKTIDSQMSIKNLGELDLKTYYRCLQSAMQHQVKLNADKL